MLLYTVSMNILLRLFRARRCALFLLLAASHQAFGSDLILRSAEGDSGERIQSMIDSLPAGREYVATVELVGQFEIANSIVMPNYTRLDLSSARLVLAAGARVPMIINADPDAGNRKIEIVGGVLDGNTSKQGPGDYHGIEFIRVEEARILDVDVRNCSGDGIRLTGKGRHTRDVQLRGLRLIDNRRCGLNVMWAERNTFVSDVFAKGNGEYGIRSDHSEGLYQNIAADQNVGCGICIRNIFGGTYNNLTASRNGGVGIHVQGMVCSRGNNWGAHNNSTATPKKLPDLFFDSDASLSYGISKHTVISNVTAGNYKQYGPATSKTAVEYGAGVREGLLIHNLLEVN